MDNEEKRNDTLTNQNPQGTISDNGTMNTPITPTNANGVSENQEENTTPQASNNGPIIETIPINNIETQPANTTPNIETIETLDEMTISTPEAPGNQIVEDNFNAVPAPPILNEEPKKNKKKNKTILYVLLILLLIGGVGVGINYFLTVSKQNAPTASINVKALKIELGEELSDNVLDYATISGYNTKECSVDKSKISSKKIGSYKFYVTCSGEKVEGLAVVDDTTKPEVTTNDVLVAPNAVITANDFIESCIDASKCTYKFVDEEAVKKNLQTIGKYKVEIIVSDEYNNETTITANLEVSNEAPVRYLTCTAPSKDEDDIYATLTNSYKFGINSQNNISNIVKISEFKFDELDDYNTIKDSYDETKGIKNIIGKASFNGNNKIITIKANKTLSELNAELNQTLGADANTLQMYMTILGYTCN